MRLLELFHDYIITFLMVYSIFRIGHYAYNLSSSTRHFYSYVITRGLQFAVLSDKYGLHFSDESLPYYDIHPSALTHEDKKNLGLLIRGKALTRGYEKIVFYNNSPLMSVPYLEMLSYSRLEVFFITRLSQKIAR